MKKKKGGGYCFARYSRVEARCERADRKGIISALLYWKKERRKEGNRDESNRTFETNNKGNSEIVLGIYEARKTHR